MTARLGAKGRITAASVSRALAAAGFVRSTTHTTRIRGWYNTTSGFSTIQYDDNAVEVWSKTGQWGDHDRAVGESERIEAWLRENGDDLTITRYPGDTTRMIVAAKGPTP